MSPRVFVMVQERVLKERQHHGRTREGVSFVLGPPGIWSMLAVLHMAEGDEQAMAQVRQLMLPGHMLLNLRERTVSWACEREWIDPFFNLSPCLHLPTSILLDCSAVGPLGSHLLLCASVPF